MPVLSRTAAHLCFALLCPLLSAPSTAQAVDLIEYEIGRHGNRFQIKIVALVNASDRAVYRVLTNYDRTDQIYPSVISSEVFRFPCDDRLELFSHVRSCIAFFCIDYEWAVKVTNLSDRRIEMETIPEYSSFGSGITIWSLSAAGDDTVVTHQTTLEPGFRVPPFIGNTIISHRLRKEVEVALERVEYFSQGLQSEEINGNLEKPR